MVHPLYVGVVGVFFTKVDQQIQNKSRQDKLMINVCFLYKFYMLFESVFNQKKQSYDMNLLLHANSTQFHFSSLSFFY